MIFINFPGGKKTNIFNYKNDRFWSFFDRNLEILDLDTKMYDFSIIFQVAKKRSFLITETIDFDRFLIEIWKS